jgi:hypothetical protein
MIKLAFLATVLAGTDCPAYEIDYEFFAGSLPLYHTAVVVKQFSTDPAH